MYKFSAAAAALLLSVSPAFGSGGLGCEVGDANLKLAIESGVTHGMGGPFFNFKANAEIMAKGTPAELAKLTLDGNLVHHWIDGKVLLLLLYRETKPESPHAYVEITVETARAEDPEQADEGSYEGTYTLNVFKAEPAEGEENPVSFQGKVSCFVE